MNLLNLPYLVQRHVLKQMTYAELFFLSFTSKKMTTLISNIGWGEIKCIRYRTSKDDYIEISAHFENGDIVKIFRIFSNKPVKEQNVNELVLDRTGICCGVFKYDEMYTEPVRPTSTFLDLQEQVPNDPLEFSNWNHSIRAHYNYIRELRTTSWPHLALFSDQLNEDPAVEAIHNRIDQLFGKNVKYELKTKSGSEELVFLPNFIKFNKTNFYFPEFDVEMVLFEEYFLRQPIQEFVFIGNTSLNGRFKLESKFYDADTLVMNPAFDIASDVLCNFRGRSVFLWDGKCSNDMIIRFLKKWKTGKSSQNLKTLRLKNSWRSLSNLNKIKQKAEIKEMTISGNMPVVDSYNDDCDLTKKPTPHTISSYIVRKDGIVAYVDVTENGIVFEVQEFTEKQMLETNNGSV